jgi:D-serine deaminase-like pyridoxal phosphate-dependent protein
VFQELLEVILASPALSIYGFYCHAGQSYASTSLDEATQFLSAELQAVNDAAEIAMSVISRTNTVSSRKTPFVLSVGSTPTAHAATPETKEKLRCSLTGELEIHAGVWDLLISLRRIWANDQIEGIMRCLTYSRLTPTWSTPHALPRRFWPR